MNCHCKRILITRLVLFVALDSSMHHLPTCLQTASAGTGMLCNASRSGTVRGIMPELRLVRFLLVHV